MLNKWLLSNTQVKHTKVLDTVCNSNHPMDVNFRDFAHESIRIGKVPQSACSVVSATILRDLDITPHDAIQSGESVLEVFSKHANTEGGCHVLRQILSSPISCPIALRRRQQALRLLERHLEEVQNDTSTAFSDLRDSEASLIWLHQVHEKQDLKQLIELMYFKLRPLRILNGVPLALALHVAYRALMCPLMSVLSPCLYILVPFFVLRFKLKLRIPFMMYIRTVAKAVLESMRHPMLSWRMQVLRFASIVTSVLIYVQGIVNTLDLSRTLVRIDGLIGNHVVSGNRFLTRSSELCDGLWSDRITACFPVQDLSKKKKSLETRRMDGVAKCGHRLAWFKSFGVTAADHSAVINKAYLLDALCAIVKAKAELRLCWPKYIRRGAQPVFAVDNVKHINLASRNTCIGNSLISNPRNVIITGPNAAGKTTFIKSTCIAAWLAQTLCVAPCDSLALTPFHYLATHIHAPDVKGHASLFEAEMFRAKDTLIAVNGLSHQQYALLVFDEIFSSTNPWEGIAAAFAILQTLGAVPNVVSMTTTHYVHLCKLQSQNPDLFTNMRFSAVQSSTADVGGGYDFSFRMERGCSNQQIALDLLSINGFDKSIIDLALRAKEEAGFE